MPLDPQARQLLDRLARQAIPPVTSLTPGEARELMEAGSILLGPPSPVERVENRTVAGPGGPVPIRIYGPGGDGPRPALVFFHGGGWVTGSIGTHDGLCRALAKASGVTLISVDYRLAPEHPFPAAVDDAFAATKWVIEHAGDLGIDPARVGVGGDSAGGNLAAVTALRARDQGGPPLALQLLIYPIIDHDLDTRSYLAYASGYLLSRDDMVWYWNQYVPDPGARRNPYASPLRAESLRDLPPALIVTAEYDPLCDEGERYAARLREDGGDVDLKRYGGMIHGFLRRSAMLDQAKTALADIAQVLRTRLGA